MYAVDCAKVGGDADAARVRALAGYKDFFALWEDADPDIPILEASEGGVREVAVAGKKLPS